MKVGSLFSGIGGFDLGLDLPVMWQVERDKGCLRVLEHHWPKTERFTDVKEVGKGNLTPVDLFAGVPLSWLRRLFHKEVKMPTFIWSDLRRTLSGKKWPRDTHIRQFALTLGSFERDKVSDKEMFMSGCKLRVLRRAPEIKKQWLEWTWQDHISFWAMSRHHGEDVWWRVTLTHEGWDKLLALPWE